MPPFTIVMPIHDEAQYLPYSLASLHALKPDEVLCLLDNSSDKSKELCISQKKHLPLRVIETQESLSQGWKSRQAAIRRHGFIQARNDIILNTDADLVLDSTIASLLRQNKDYPLIRFSFMDYPANIQTLSKQVVSRLTPFKGYAGLYGFHRKAWLESEDQEDARQAEAEDTHLQLSIMRHYPSKYIHTRSLHLRASETPQNQYWRGQQYCKTVNSSQIVALAHSLAIFRPMLFVGYRHARSQTP